MNSPNRLVYPFSAIVGQEKMKKALLLNVINSKIGGVLLRGQKGTAKSLAVRSLSRLLPSIKAVSGCPFSCDPEGNGGLCDACLANNAAGGILNATEKQVTVVELPVGATEDRVIGTLDIERAIKTGEKRFEPGLLAAANRGILYIDEVNLLDDHLVDILLDAAAMGMNFVEREGISFRHPAQFTLVGTMNPEEGELRPQLLDRFGLSVDVTGILERDVREQVVKRRIAFEADPEAFIASWEKEQETIRRRIDTAKVLLPKVALGEDLLHLVTRLCLDFAVDGHRADIVIYKTACTIAAYHARTTVNEQDVREAAELALIHRQRRQPFEEPELDKQKLEESLKDWQQEQQNSNGESGDQNKDSHSGENTLSSPDDNTANDNEPGNEQVLDADPPYKIKPLAAKIFDQKPRDGSGRRSKNISNDLTGRYTGSKIPQGKVTDLALDATLRAAAPYQIERRSETPGQTALLISPHDMREKVRKKKIGNLVIFVLDASGSMAAEERMSAAKGALLSLLLDAYQKRDKVGMVIFREEKAELVLPPTNSVTLAQKLLSQLPSGGRTPLAHGLKLALDTIKNYLMKDNSSLPLLVLISDGKANVSINGGNPIDDAKQIAREIKADRIRAIAVDTESDFITFGLVKEIADSLEASYMHLEDLKAGPIASAVRCRLDDGK